ncbi:hypothetical protein Tco_0338232 [Tanacetum coccineum]
MFKPPRALRDGYGRGSFFDNHVKTSKIVFKFLQTRFNHADFRKFFWNLNFGGSTRKSGIWRIHRILRPKGLLEMDIRENDEKSSKNEQNRARNGKA